MSLVRTLVFVALLSCSLLVAAAPRPYIVDVPTSAAEAGYFSDLLLLVLNASKASDEQIEIRYAQDQLSQARWVAAVAQGQGNTILWTMTSKAREEALRPIRFPLMKGLMGYRVLVIRKGDEALYANLKTQQDFEALTAGQGMHWPDTGILRANGFHTVEALSKEHLYKMLAAKRFDFFPRGITEIPGEQALINAHALRVVPHVLLHYSADLYFFVNKANTELAERLERGWAIVLKNGDYEKFFLSYEHMRTAVEFLSEHHYTLIELNNPYVFDAAHKSAH